MNRLREWLSRLLAGKTERRLATVILVTTMVPLAAALYLATSMFRQASAIWFNPDIGEQLDRFRKLGRGCPEKYYRVSRGELVNRKGYQRSLAHRRIVPICRARWVGRARVLPRRIDVEDGVLAGG